MPADPSSRRRGAVAVIIKDGKFLVIRRGAEVAAPLKLCFPGGGIEPGETDRDALQRELHEELQLELLTARECWTSITPWDVALSWWQATIADDAQPLPNPSEVEGYYWLTPMQLQQHKDTLASNLDFLDAWRRGELSLDGLEVP